jgi:simple sugar transport system permease protein
MSAGNANGGARASGVATLAGLAAAMIAFDVLVWAYGESPRELAVMLYEGTWGSAFGAGQVLFKATPLLFTGVAVDLALRAGLFNIGADGQLAMASLAAGVVGAELPQRMPSIIALPVVVLVAVLTGGAWALVPAVLKGRFGAHEVISTIMMNRIADAAVGLSLGLGAAEPGTVRTRDLVLGARLPRLDLVFQALRGSAVSFALFAAAATAAVVTNAYGATRFGREIGLIGMNPVACAAQKIPVGRRVAQALVLSGAIAGLASVGTVLGYKGYFEQGLGAGAGFGGIAVAMIGRGSAIGLVFAALLFGTLQQGGLAINAHVPMEVMDVLQGVVIASVALADARVRAALAQAVGKGVVPA